MPFKVKTCSHLANVMHPKKAKKYVCEECEKTNSKWVHLRTCQECGITLCCDSSPNQHATKHANSHKHPVISSAEPGEYWLYCYTDQLIKKYQPL